MEGGRLMTAAENKDLTRDLLLRISPSRNTLVIEEHKPGGIVSYREIDPLELYYIFNGSYAHQIPAGEWESFGIPSLHR